jgi:hypothetical protein
MALPNKCIHHSSVKQHFDMVAENRKSGPKKKASIATQQPINTFQMV